MRKKKDGFPFPDQVEDRFHGNDRRNKKKEEISGSVRVVK